MRRCLECGGELAGENTVCPECARVASGPGSASPFPQQPPASAQEGDAAARAWQSERDARRPQCLRCLRCDEPLERLGTKTFEIRSVWDGLGLLGLLAEPNLSLDVYSCPRCGKVELFRMNVGRPLREA